jgi:hypothetical protein
MKKISLLLLINLLTAISCFSQDIYPKKLNDSLVIITSEQLKKTNLIFLEHNKLSKENKMLYDKVSLLDSLNNNYVKIDSLNTITINSLKQELNEKAKKNKPIKNYLIGGSFGAILGLVLGIILL